MLSVGAAPRSTRLWHDPVVLALALAMLACSGSDRGLEGAIAEAVARGDGTIIRMPDIAAFEWDRLHVFAPFTSLDDVDRRLGFHWPAQSTGIDRRDDIALLVFVRGSEVVRYVSFPRRDGDFSEIRRPGGFTRKEAVFGVVQDPEAPRLLVRELARAAG